MLSACGRVDYTTWKCQDVDGQKLSMIIKQAQMILPDTTYTHCGALGEVTYFDNQCPALTQDAQVRFIPGQGKLNIADKAYQCTAL
ncbi:hypothetical protein G6732_06795 [Polynucleobacter paneuropaeus]|nr:hypothetical protein [Polynucleobacter paneuropaeus]